MQDERQDTSGAYVWKPLLDEQEPVAEDFENPAGIGRGECDSEDAAGADESCDLEATAQVDDMVLEESKPGIGIEGFEGEEVGGG